MLREGDRDKWERRRKGKRGEKEKRYVNKDEEGEAEESGE